MEKYFKIGEISRLYHIGVDSLRYYEEIGVIVPHRAESGYRLYSIHDIWRLNVIRELRELNFSMEEIKRYLNCHTVDSTLHLLEQEQDKICAKLQMLMELQTNVQQRMQTIRSALECPMHQITVKNYSVRHCFSISEGYTNEDEMDVLIKRLLNIDQERFYVIGNNQIGTVISLEKAQSNGAVQYQSVFIMDEHGRDALPGGLYLSVSYRGRYDQSAEWIQALLSYAGEHHLKPTGDLLEILWVDIHTTSDVQERITELQLPVEKNACI